MNEKIKKFSTLFIENRDIIKAGFSWENSYIYPVCAAIFMEKGRTADVGRMKECRQILMEQTGLFSNFRGIAKLAMVSLLAVDGEPERKMERSMEVYQVMKERFFGSSYLPVASMLIADVVSPSEFDTIAERTRKIYDLMKREHPFLTSSEDSIFAAMLALSDKPETVLIEETERCYNILRSEFYSGNAVQSLSHVLALADLPADVKCERTLQMYRMLKSRGYAYGTGYELATLGVLALLGAGEQDAAAEEGAGNMGQAQEDTMETIMEEVMETDDFLSGQKGYGIFGLGRKQRLMHAGMIVTSAHMGTDGEAAQTLQQAAIGGTVSLIAAQQAAMCAAIAASSAAAASASSGSN